MPSRSNARHRSRRSGSAEPTTENLPAKAGSDRTLLIVLIALYVILAAAYAKLVPFRSGPEAAALIHSQQLPVNPDEAAHVANAEVYRSGHIPVFHVGSPDFEAHQPPLYYVMIAPLLGPRGSAQPAVAARWLGIVLGALTILAMYAFVRQAFPGRSETALSCAAFVALLPTNVNLCAAISNDVLTNLVVVAALWQMAVGARGAQASDRSATVRSAVASTLLLAAGLYSKTLTLVLFPAIIGIAFVAWRERLGSAGKVFGIAAAVIGGALLLASPWLLRNTRLYGDPLAQHIFLAAFGGTTMTARRMMQHMDAVSYWLLVARVTFESFWGVFDAMQLFYSTPSYILIGLLTIAGAAGAWRAWRNSKLDAAQKMIGAAMLLVGLGTVAAFVRFNMTFFQAQGRYLYTALVPISFLLCAGWLNLAGNPDSALARRMPYIVAGVLILLNAYALHLLQAVFG